MDLMNIMDVSGKGLQAQSLRMRISAENIANADSVQSEEGGPYLAKQVYFKSVLNRQTGLTEVQVAKVDRDTKTPPTYQYQPGHDLANEKGYVAYPNVNGTLESINMKEAQRSYEANLAALSTTREMMTRTLDLLR
ncbi:MAG: flagellar basal body rod protein FlgC [Alphaproteobacteria bacterium CG_4_10_14_0_8_um_filter_53_9]|nr:MAG: flagellar basal body rod protein FlgC [Alphaproteobacteria bacterium CG_4_10_14_0_8_um_filter_53_9]